MNLRRWEAAAPIGVVLFWVALWLATAPYGDFPLNDDWAYGLAARSIVETGRFTLLPWSSANAFAQAYWGALFCGVFGFSFQVLRVSTAVLGAVGVLAAYGLLRELGARAELAALGALVVGCNPLYLSQSVTFMTDVPFAALVIVSLWLYCRSVGRGGRAALAAAYGVGLVAVLIRQFAMVLPVAFALPALRRRVSVRRAAMLGVLVLLSVALHLGYQRWMIATQRTSGFESPIGAFLHLGPSAAVARLRSAILPAVGLVGMGLLPLSIVDPARLRPAGRPALWRGVTIGLAAALLAGLVVKHEIPPLGGNVVSRFGIGPLTLSDTYQFGRYLPVVPGAEAFWLALSVGACWGAAIGGAAMLAVLMELRRLDRPDQVAMLLGFIEFYGGAVLAFAMIAPLFDRYLIPLLAPAVAMIVVAARGRSPAGLAVASVLVAGMAAFSVATTHDWLAWHRSRWEAVRFLDGQSVAATKVDGGYEYNGMRTYQPVPPQLSRSLGWWVVDDEYRVAAGPADGFQEIASLPVEAWLWRGARIFVLRRD